MSFTPASADRFSFDLWTIGWVGQDQFGAASREPLEVVEAVETPLTLSWVGADR